MKNKFIKKYGIGGFLKGLGNTIKDFGMYQLDNATSIINPDIIDSSNYDTKFFKGASNFMGGLINKAAPIAANALLPGSGYAVSAIQGMSKSFVPEDEERKKSKINSIGEGLSPTLNYIPFDKMFTSVPTFGQGGEVNKTLINTEKGELLVSPKGVVLKEYNGFPKHPDDGIDPRGNTLEDVGNIVIPKKFSKQFKNTRVNSPERNTIILNVLKNQSENEAMEQLGMYKKGGKIYIKPENRGKFTEYAKSKGMSVQEAANDVLANESQHSSALIKRAVFAKNASKWKHENGGIIKYGGGGRTSFSITGKPMKFKPLDYSPITTFPTGTSYGLPLKKGFEIPDYSIFGKSNSNDNKIPKESNSSDDRIPSWYETAGEFLANSAGPLYNLFSYTKPQPVTYQRVTPSYVSPDAALLDSDVQARTSWKNLRSISGGNAGLYLSNLNTISNENFRNKYKIRTEYNNINSEINNKINSLNAEIAMRERDANDANLGKYHETKSQSISKLGTNVAEAIKGRNFSIRDLETLKYLKRVYPDLFK